MSAAQSAIAPADCTVELSIDLRTKHQHALATDNVHVVADTCADRPSRPGLARVASSSALHAPRSASETLIESDAFMTFKTNLIFNDIWSVMIVIAIIAWSVAFTISGDATSTSLGFALAKASEIARIMSFCVLAIVAGSSIMLNNIDPSTTGRLATMRSIALAVQNSAVFPYAVSFLSIGFTTQLGLRLLWFTTLEPCTAAPLLFGAKLCTPSTFSLPADRVAIIFIAPIIVQVFFPSTRLASLLCSWLIGCICIALSYARIGVFVDSLNLLTAVFVPIIMFKFDAAMWSSFTLHTKTLRDAERELAAAQRTRALERTLMETEKHTIETREADLRSIMGNVAHDLKTPIQSISMGIELLRSEAEACQCRQTHCGTSELIASPKLLDGIWAACEFMKMAISRSINFTKASANIALLPALETVDLSAPLLVAANIIRTLNPEVPLSVEPLPAEMCAFVVTDRHWLGENALCLLSNAVKYSDGGPIRINVTLRGQNASWRMAKLANTAVSSGLTLSSEDPTADDDPDQAQASNPRQFVRVSVIDSGIGVRPESRQHLFQPFGQTQRRAGGTGLGLYSLRKRMEALHGACGVCRRADGQRGSEFWFEFPYRPDHGVTASASAAASAPTAVPSSTGPSRHHAAAHQDKPPTEALTDSTAAPVLSIAADHHVSVECALPVSWAVRRSPCLGGGTKSKSEALRILIVEDSIFILNMASQILRKRGHMVETAVNGSAGLDRLSAVCETGDDFDLVLCDFQMPVMDGFEMARRYRQFEASLPSAQGRQRPPMAIVGMSANTDLTSQSLATDVGMNAFMPKPFSAADMQAVLDLFGL